MTMNGYVCDEKSRKLEEQLHSSTTHIPYPLEDSFLLLCSFNELRGKENGEAGLGMLPLPDPESAPDRWRSTLPSHIDASSLCIGFGDLIDNKRSNWRGEGEKAECTQYCVLYPLRSPIP